MEYYFSTNQLAIGYGKEPLVRDINIHLHRGKILTLIGPNGSGKSTLLKTITKQLQSIDGTVSIGGQAISTMSDRDLSRRVSVVLTDRMHSELMTCEDIVETGRYPYTGKLGILSPDDKAEVEKAMALTHITELRAREFSQISDGQRQRVLLARAICQQPQIIVLDEPTSFLDIHYKLEFLNLLRSMAKERNIAVILSLHELDLAQRISDDVLCLKGKTIFHYGTAEETFNQNLICELYDMEEDSYNSLFGCLEMKRTEAAPKTFVIAGGGTGISVYRSLQKQQIPFVTGIIHENDVDYQVARYLANEVITEKSFELISEDRFQKAVNCLKGCNSVINCLTTYGKMNVKNRELFEIAKSMGLRCQARLTHN